MLRSCHGAILLYTRIFFRLAEPRLFTDKLEMKLEHLLPCEKYLVCVALAGPIGPGPLQRNPLVLDTPYNENKPPRNVRANINGHTMNITWGTQLPTDRSISTIVHSENNGIDTESNIDHRTEKEGQQIVVARVRKYSTRRCVQHQPVVARQKCRSYRYDGVRTASASTTPAQGFPRGEWHLCHLLA